MAFVINKFTWTVYWSDVLCIEKIFSPEFVKWWQVLFYCRFVWQRLTLLLLFTGPALVVDLLKFGVHLPVVLHLLHHEHPAHVVQVHAELLGEEVLLRLDPNPVGVDPGDAAVPLFLIALSHDLLKREVQVTFKLKRINGKFISSELWKVKALRNNRWNDCNSSVHWRARGMKEADGQDIWNLILEIWSKVGHQICDLITLRMSTASGH